MSSRLLDHAARRPIVLDAGMGTRLMERGLSLDGDDPCLWNFRHPDAVSEIHALDVAAGALAVLTNTFGANRPRLDRFGRGDETRALNLRAATLAREAVGASGFVIGSIGPISGDFVGDSYREQAEALAEGGVDALVFETHEIDSAATALRGVGPYVNLPLIVSLWTWDAAAYHGVRRLEDLGASALGGNCTVGMGPMIEMADRLSTLTRLPLCAKPSANLPGETVSSPESFAESVPALLRSGVRFFGGCCGTTEAHVAALRAACYADPS